MRLSHYLRNLIFEIFFGKFFRLFSKGILGKVGQEMMREICRKEPKSISLKEWDSLISCIIVKNCFKTGISKEKNQLL